MEDEKNMNVDPNEGDGSPIDYVGAIEKLKSESVPKDKYESLVKENEKLLNALVNGEQLTNQKESDTVDIAELRKQLFNEELTNLEYVNTALKLRSALIEQGEQDPFLPYGDRVTITQDMVDCAERTAQVFKECLDVAKGDSGIFTAELQRRTTEALPVYSRAYRR